MVDCRLGLLPFPPLVCRNFISGRREYSKNILLEFGISALLSVKSPRFWQGLLLLFGRDFFLKVADEFFKFYLSDVAFAPLADGDGVSGDFLIADNGKVGDFL